MKLFFLVAAVIFGGAGMYTGLVLRNMDDGAFLLALGAYNYAIYLSDTKQDKPE